MIVIIINTGNLFHTTSLTCGHVDHLVLCSYMHHHNSVTGIVSKLGFRSLMYCIQTIAVCSSRSITASYSEAAIVIQYKI